MSNFITNSKEKSLEQRIRTLISNSEELKFLVGFFYFSGIDEIYQELKKLYENGMLKEEHLKVLVGLNIDTNAYGIYEVAKIEKLFNINSAKEDLLKSLRIAFTSKDLDKKEIHEQIDFFIKLLLERKLVIRKTKEPNHAKLYLFKLNDNVKNVVPNLFITGSSNLTRAGLKSQNEFNVEIKDYGFEEAEKYFDNLWRSSIQLSQEDVVRVCETLKNETFIRQITPLTAYAYLLKLYLDLHKGKSLSVELIKLMEQGGYKPYTYQLEAVSQAQANCEIHGGTIIADVVGLGKTIIACMTAKALGKRGIVLCPPHLIGDENKRSGWRKYLADFKLWDWEARSIGKLEEVLEFVKDNRDIEVVIVDEAHRFRNERTESYHYLREICRGKTVILLTATPFNNRPSDLFALLKLFTIPKKSTIVLDENLEERFNDYEIRFKKLAYIKNHYNSRDSGRKKRALRYYKELFKSDELDVNRALEEAKKLAETMKSILEPVVIRRNRLDLKNYNENISFPIVKDPLEWFFELTKEQSEFYDEVINTFSLDNGIPRFKGAIYFPIKYEKGLDISIDELEEVKLGEEENFIYIYQRNLYDLMRRLLVKRFESSFGAFKQSVSRFKEVHRRALYFVEKTNKFILNKKLMEKISYEDPETITEALEEYEKSLKEIDTNDKYNKVYDLEKFKQRDKFIEHIESDIRLFEELENKIDEVGLSKEDPKADTLARKMEEFLKEGRKVVIFTEYLDTATYLEEYLKNIFGSILLSAYGNISKSDIEAIYENFDAQYKNQKDDYKILLTTDKLSEGFNLNRAGVVINYDIPWNPVRVIQRVGRINRIGKKVYDEIYIVNFFPTEKGADLVRSREIATTKMFMIHNVLGEDSKIFAPDEEPQPSELYRRLTTYIEDEEESFFTKVRKEYNLLLEKYPHLKEEIKNIPNRVKVAKYGDQNELMVFVKKNKDLFVGYKNYAEKQPVATTFKDVYEKIKVDKDMESLPLSEDFWKNYHQILDTSSYLRRSIPRANDLSHQALNLLNSLLDIKEESIKKHRKFISDLIEDIKENGTLSEYILSEIVKMESIITDTKKLSEKIEEIRNELGDDFLEKVREHLKNITTEVVIAIENIKTED